MKKALCCCLLFVGLLAFAQAALADSVVGTAGNDWRTWAVGALDQDGRPYWDHASSDGRSYNVGYYLTNSGAFSGGTAGPGTIPFWGGRYNSARDTGGAADPDFYFTGSTAKGAALKVEVAGWKDTNVFGWYDVKDPRTLHPIFSGSANAGAAATFKPSTDYGFYFSTMDGIFKTESSKNTDRNGHRALGGEQHFALFQDGSGNFWIGMEDTRFSASDKDYNDMIVKVSVAHAPIPGSLLLLAPGLFGLALARRRLRK